MKLQRKRTGGDEEVREPPLAWTLEDFGDDCDEAEDERKLKVGGRRSGRQRLLVGKLLGRLTAFGWPQISWPKRRQLNLHVHMWLKEYPTC